MYRYTILLNIYIELFTGINLLCILFRKSFYTNRTLKQKKFLEYHYYEYTLVCLFITMVFFVLRFSYNLAS